MSHLSVMFIVGAGPLGIEVVEGNVDAKEVNGVLNGRGVVNGSPGL